MILSDLIKGVEIIKAFGNTDVHITGLCLNDCQVKRGDLFFCIKGTKEDGHEYVYEAVSRGAAAVVCERRLDVDVPQIVVSSVRQAMSQISSAFYGNPSKRLKIVGVTGTNGKTSTCHLIRSILRFAGEKVGVIGTLGIFYSNVEIAPELTTPDPIFLHGVFADMVKAGVKYVVMEVSAHAIELEKICGIRFEVGVFTNCTQDHLDFFKTMERYSASKSRFLTEDFCDFTVFNTDDELGRRLFLSAGKKSLSYGIECPSDVFAVNVKEELGGVSFVMNLLDNIYDVECKMSGLFNVYNCLAAATCCAVLGVDFDDIVNGIKYCQGVSGRVEQVKNGQDKMIFVDYAHTPDGLKNVLATLKKCVKGRLMCLFGCGGNRDRSKRAIMGEVAGELADFCIITSDNPRFEDPCDIISDIEKGIRLKTQDYITIQDRRSAVRYALSSMKTDDVLLIAGKGAEEYQEIMGVKHDYNDKKYVQKILGGSDKA